MQENIEHFRSRGSSSSGRHSGSSYSRSSYNRSSRSSNRRYSSPKPYNHQTSPRIVPQRTQTSTTTTMGSTGGALFWGWNVYPAPNILYPYFMNDISEVEEIVPIERKLK